MKMEMEMYEVKVNWFNGNPIQKIIVEKQTDKSVWIRGSRFARRSDYTNYVETLDEAKKILKDYFQNKLDQAERYFKKEQETMEKVNNYIEGFSDE
jgi:predicted metal-binding protein